MFCEGFYYERSRLEERKNLFENLLDEKLMKSLKSHDIDSQLNYSLLYVVIQLRTLSTSLQF